MTVGQGLTGKPQTAVARLVAALSIVALFSCSPAGESASPTLSATASAENEASHAATTNEEIVFDGYVRGVPAIEIKIDGDVLTVRKRDFSANAWGDAVSGPIDKLPDDPRMRFEGALADFPLDLRLFSRADWSGSDRVGWEDKNARFVKHRELRETIDGEETVAFHWAQIDSVATTRDVIVGADNKIIGAVDPRNDIVLVRRGFENFTSVKHWRNPQVSQPLYGYKELPLVMMPTRAGPRLATLVYLPEGDIEGPFPTILVRTPYGISDLIDRYKHYPVRGFAVVLQAAQGTIYWDEEARSEGDQFSTVNEPGDGADALEWIAAQSWSNGEICSEGGSYRGFTQWTAAMSRNPALKCLIPEVSMGTAFSDQPYMGGTFVQGIAYYEFWMMNKGLLEGRTWPDVFRHRPIIDIDRYATGEDIPLWNELIENATNSDFWRVQDWYAGEHPRDFGTFQISGWFDDDFPGTRSNWALMDRYGSQPNRLLIGPWRHGYNRDRMLNGYRFGVDAIRPDVWLLKQKWYDHFLKGFENGVTDAKVEYFVLGENEWRTADAWPPAESEARQYFFHSDGAANRFTDDGVLRVEPPQRPQPFEEYTYDPANAVKNWYSFDLMESWADYQSYPYDFKDVETRADVVTYTTPPLEDDVTIAGNIKVVLYASTDVKDTDWWAYVSDVAPDYSSTRLSVGALRARFRGLDDPDTHIFGSNFEKEELLSGDIDDVVRYEISIPSVANTFKKGHRIRVAIMNAHENYSFPNSNTGAHEGYATRTIPGKMRIHHSPEHPGHILLPVMPQD